MHLKIYELLKLPYFKQTITESYNGIIAKLHFYNECFKSVCFPERLKSSNFVHILDEMRFVSHPECLSIQDEMLFNRILTIGKMSLKAYTSTPQ